MAGKVLIVDDEEWICNLMQDYLLEEGYKVQIAMDLKSAKATLAGPELPDVVVLDVMLPDGNGIDYLAEIRSAPRTKTLPVIVITAHRVQTKDRIMGFDTGADDYLTKPFDLREFRSRLDRLIKRVHTTQKIVGQPAEEVKAQNGPSVPPPRGGPSQHFA